MGHYIQLQWEGNSSCNKCFLKRVIQRSVGGKHRKAIAWEVVWNDHAYTDLLHCLACYERSLHLDITLTYQAAMGHPLPAHIWKLKLDIMIIWQRSKFRPCSGGNITSQQNNGLSYLIYSSIARTSDIRCMWELRKSFPRQVIQSPHCLIIAAHC